MATIVIKNSVTPGATPPTLQDGELALNAADNELYFKDASNAVVSILSIDCGEVTP